MSLRLATLISLPAVVAVFAVAGCGSTQTTTSTARTQEPAAATISQAKPTPKVPAKTSAKRQTSAKITSDPADPQAGLTSGPQWQRVLYASLTEDGRKATTAKTSQATVAGEMHQWIADDKTCVTQPAGSKTSTKTQLCGHTVVVACIKGGHLRDYIVRVSSVAGQVPARCVNGTLKLKTTATARKATKKAMAARRRQLGSSVDTTTNVKPLPDTIK
jgi:hypothetical protein